MVLWLSKYQKSREKVKFALQATTVLGQFLFATSQGDDPDGIRNFQNGGNVQAKDL